MTQEIQKAAKREMERMEKVFAGLQKHTGKQIKEFYDFSFNYYSDGLFFYNEKKKYVEAFEAFIIAWAYLDAGMKLGYFSVPEEQKKWFTA